MISTARYSNKTLQQPSYYPVGISVGKPKFALNYVLRDQCYALAPYYSMLNLDSVSYETAYNEKLNKLGVQKVIGIVRGLERKATAEGKTLVLLCFEDIRIPGDWCHRRLFAAWWKEHTGEDINELPEVDPPKLKKPTTSTVKTEPVKKTEPVEKPAVEEPQYEQLSLFPA